MKNFFFLLLCSMIIAISACGDDDCEPGQLETNIVGEWNVTLSGLTFATVEFRANGDFIDQSGYLVPDTILGLPVESKTYSVPSDTTITLTAGSSFGNLDYNVDVLSYTCDDVTVNVQGTEYILKRED